MKKKALLKKKTTPVKKSSPVRKLSKQPNDQYVILVRSWVFLVLFAIMLGMGALLGGALKTQLEGNVPVVAGASTEAR